jgi:drug/metabolite transporter (DMT)-like permease
MNLTPVYLAIFISVLCMSTSSIIIRFCTAPALIISFYRVIFASLIAAGIGSSNPVGIKELSRRDLKYILLSGVFLALHLGFWISSLSYTSISSSVLFTNLQVIFVLILSALLLKEQVHRWVYIGIFTALLGSILIVRGDLQSGRLLGDLLALLSGLFVAIYFLIGRQVRARVDVWTYTAVVSGVAAAVLLIGSKAAGLDFFGYPKLDWLLFFIQAAGPGIIGHATINWALKYVKAPIVSVSILGESVGASLLAFIIFQEALAWYQLIGGFFILTGIYIAASHEKTIPPPVEAEVM